ncbi:MAG: prolyl oligopeptidase family serine peptidase [Planctomycetales bacterium]|nr:prolyl oligopeptidase family serine peptidase [Planctomycetales bacterium]
MIRPAACLKAVVVALSLFTIGTNGRASERLKVMIPSTIDRVEQLCYVMLPDKFDAEGEPAPLLVSLHSWSGDCEQRKPDLEAGAAERGWIYLAPNFRGPNDDPDACGSEKAQQDILDAVEWAKKTYRIDSRRVYLTGASGGGHMTLLMAGRHPGVWAAASAWVGISDLKAWHEKHAATRYGQMMRACCGGAPGDSEAVDREYRERSPLTHLKNAVNLPLDISAGIHDGHTGSVPIWHSLAAFNVIAEAGNQPSISPQAMQELSRPEGRLSRPQASDREVDASFGREIYLRRMAGPARVTIFEGGHERIDSATLAWLERHVKKVGQ